MCFLSFHDRRNQDIFYRLLRKYLQTIYHNEKDVQMAFLFMISLMARLRDVSNDLGRKVRQVDPVRERCPIAREIVVEEDKADIVID